VDHLDHDISVLVVDDHRVFADVLALRLQREEGIAEVRLAYDLDEARAVLSRTHPDIVILDYDVAGRPGTELIADLQQGPSPPQVVMLSATEEVGAAIESLDSAASAWVAKDADLDVLLTALREVLHGRMYLDPDSVRPVVQRLLDDTRRRSTTFVDELSPRQLDVLRCLVAGLSRAETGRRLYITANTVRTHVQHLFRVSGLHSTLALAARARELGVAPIDPEPGLEPSPNGSPT
jgi:two-component system nitrate/nitrite response regulator NarL